MENIENDRETIVLTFWETKEDIENYYSKDNKILYDLVESQTNVWANARKFRL